MKYSSPEKCGVSTAAIKKYVNHLNRSALSTHSVIIAKGDNIIFEKYWKPFNRDFLHRMYSVTKSFVALGIGFLVDEGRVSLDDPISKYFPEECSRVTNENIKNQTVRHMLQMRSAFPKNYPSWFETSPEDRVLDYFTNNSGSMYPSGTMFKYDSTGSFVLGALVERVAGKKLTDYLYEKFLAKLGVEGAYMLECPGGHSWSDSALLMRPIDLLKVGRFLLLGGKWEGEQLLSEAFVKEATSNLVSTSEYGFANDSAYGYGYLIWRQRENSFFFNGMGCQFCVMCPDKDMILVYNGDNQGNPLAKTKIIDGFFDMVYSEVSENPLPEYSGEPIPEDDLFYLKGDYASPLMDKINGKKYVFKDNYLGISEFTLTFDGDEGKFEYVKKSEKKIINFGLGKNVFEKFCEEGYSDKVGSKRCPGNRYNCASSAAALSPDDFMIRVQIIDKYFGNMSALFTFNDDIVTVQFRKCAEDFLGGYSGFAVGKAEN